MSSVLTVLMVVAPLIFAICIPLVIFGRIADRAGYSYATLYNYFKDINDLVFLCVHDFYAECLQHVKDHAKKNEKGTKRLKASIRAYADFFVQYPGIFGLFFMENLGSFSDKKNVAGLIASSLDAVCEEEWNYCISKGVFKADDVELIKSQIRHCTLGLLMLYLNQRTSYPYSEFIHQLNTLVNGIMGEVGMTSIDTRATVHAGDTEIHNSLISIKIGNNAK